MPDCHECRAVPYIVYEAEQARNERTFRRMWVVVLVLIVLLVGSNIAWLAYESQFETVESTVSEYEVKQETDSGGYNNYIYTGGDYYGDANSKTQDN